MYMLPADHVDQEPDLMIWPPPPAGPILRIPHYPNAYRIFFLVVLFSVEK
jgi:hypothetical protein